MDTNIAKLFQTVAASSDYNDAFMMYKKIKDEGNNDFKRQIKFKMGLHLLAGVGCYKNIAEGCKFIIEAGRLGLSDAIRWTKDHGNKDDYSAGEASKIFFR
ncbi:26715_t:CDS:2 [Dentiscutata erythropus]|uniref:26715_t:CDS:1 n=1 Tax=Dentiscutata erythropus TaxID=1348616 RepID=A0A9N9JMR2_9GLOM|nr:26715_t:CDS:2 [Dentiscutata erythropus]